MEKTFRPDFIIIPMQLVLDKNIQPLDERLYGIIYWLSKLAVGKCIASNEFLADVNDCTIQSLKRSLLRLEKNSYIRRTYSDPARKNREEIIPLISFGVAPNGALVGAPNGAQISNTINKKQLPDSKAAGSSNRNISDYFCDKVLEVSKNPYPFNGGKDGAAIKRALKLYSLKDIKEIIDYYFYSDKIKSHGYSLSIALSADTIGKWLYDEKRLS